MKFEHIPANIKKQYVELYGEFVSGDYAPGDEIPGQGEVLWSYLSAARGVVYVVGGWRAWPKEIAANEVQQGGR